MPRRKDFRYAELPVFKYQTFDPNSLTFTDHPIVPPEKINFSNRSAEELFTHDDDAASEPEVVVLTDDQPPEPEPEVEVVEVKDEPAEPGSKSSLFC